jgi:hypothetical protein
MIGSYPEPPGAVDSPTADRRRRHHHHHYHQSVDRTATYLTRRDPDVDDWWKTMITTTTLMFFFNNVVRGRWGIVLTRDGIPHVGPVAGEYWRNIGPGTTRDLAW